MPKSFTTDGISIKELLIILACIFNLLVLTIHSTFVFISMKYIDMANVTDTLPILVNFLADMAVYYVIPYIIVICFYFLNEKTADVIKHVFSLKNTKIVKCAETQIIEVDKTDKEALENNSNIING